MSNPLYISLPHTMSTRTIAQVLGFRFILKEYPILFFHSFSGTTVQSAINLEFFVSAEGHAAVLYFLAKGFWG